MAKDSAELYSFLQVLGGWIFLLPNNNIFISWNMFLLSDHSQQRAAAVRLWQHSLQVIVSA